MRHFLKKYKAAIAAVCICMLLFFVIYNPPTEVSANPVITLIPAAEAAAPYIAAALVAAGLTFADENAMNGAINEWYENASENAKEDAAAIFAAYSTGATFLSEAVWDFTAQHVSTYQVGDNGLSSTMTYDVTDPYYYSDHYTYADQTKFFVPGVDTYYQVSIVAAGSTMGGHIYKYRNGQQVASWHLTYAGAIGGITSEPYINSNGVLVYKVGILQYTGDVYKELWIPETIPVLGSIASLTIPYTVGAHPKTQTPTKNWPVEEEVKDWYYPPNEVAPELIDWEFKNLIDLNKPAPTPPPPEPEWKVGRIIWLPDDLEDLINNDPLNNREGIGNIVFEPEPITTYYEDPPRYVEPGKTETQTIEAENKPDGSSVTTVTKTVITEIQDPLDPWAPPETAEKKETITVITIGPSPENEETRTIISETTDIIPLPKPDSIPQPDPVPEPDPPTSETTPNPDGTSTTTHYLPDRITDIITDTTKDPETGERTPNTLNFEPLRIAGKQFTWKFPFCLPWDILRGFQSLLPDDEFEPIIHVDLGSDIARFKFDIDLTNWNSVAAVARTVELILFDFGLVLITRKLMGGDV